MSTEKDTDLRVLRTQELIRSAFFELMGDIGFDKITVSNLVKKAGINRSTFYLHYTDKFDLLNTLEQEILAGLREILLSVDFEIIFDFVYKGEPYPHILKILTYVNAHEQFYKLILSPGGDPSFINKIGDFIRSMMSEIVNRYGIMDKLKIPLHYVVPMFVAVITSFLNEWVQSGMKETPYELASMMTLVIHKVPQGIIDLS